MAYEEYNLPITDKGEVLPQELQAQYYANLDKALARAEARNMERIQGTLENQGFFRSGQNLQDVSEQVLGPAGERRAQYILPEIQRGAMLGREERLTGEEFSRKQQFATEEQMRALERMDKQAQIDRALMELKADLSDTGFGWGNILGQGAGIALGGAFGGIGAGVGGGIGSRLGGLFGKKSGDGGQ